MRWSAWRTSLPMSGPATAATGRSCMRARGWLKGGSNGVAAIVPTSVPRRAANESSCSSGRAKRVRRDNARSRHRSHARGGACAGSCRAGRPNESRRGAALRGRPWLADQQLPCASSLQGTRAAAVDGQVDAGDVGGRRRAQERDRRGGFLRPGEAAASGSPPPSSRTRLRGLRPVLLARGLR